MTNKFTIQRAKLSMREIIDVHIHPIKALTTIERLLREMEKSNVIKGVLLALDVDPLALEKRDILSEVLGRIMGFSMFADPERIFSTMRRMLEGAVTTNQKVKDLVQKYPDRFVGFGSVNISLGKEYSENMLKKIVEFNFKGIKLLPTLQFFNPSGKKYWKTMKKVWKTAQKHDLTLLCHSGFDPGPWELPLMSEDAHPLNLEKIIKKFPKVPVIIAHMGGYTGKSHKAWVDDTLDLGKRYQNVLVDTSAVPTFLIQKKIVEKIRKCLGFERVLFGSDFPVVRGTGILDSVKIIEESPYLSEVEKNQIFYENAADLLGFPEKERS